MSTDITSVGGVGALQPGDTATVQWRDGFTQITGEVVSVERTSPTSWSVRFGGRVPFRVHVAEGEWRFVGAVPRRVTPEERVRAEARTVRPEQVEAAAEALFRQVFGQGWENEPDRVRVFYRSEVREILTAAGLTVPEEEARA